MMDVSSVVGVSVGFLLTVHLLSGCDSRERVSGPALAGVEVNEKGGKTVR